MAGWNGSGTWSRAYDWTNERDAGYNIDATKFDAENDAISDGINNCLTKDGQNAPTANLPMGGYKHTGVADGTAANHYATLGQIQGGAQRWGGTAGGTANAQTINLSPAISSYTAGLIVTFFPAATNTGAMTLNVNGLGAKSVLSYGQSLGGGEAQVFIPCTVVYDGGSFNLISNAATLAPAAKAYANVLTTLTTGDQIGVSFGAVDYEYPGSMWDAGDDQFLVAPVRGIYSVRANIGMGAAGGVSSDFDVYALLTRYSGGTPYQIAKSGATNFDGVYYHYLVVTSDCKLSAGDKIGVIVYQDSGVSWQTITGPVTHQYPCTLSEGTR
jgi:hypothetical protein